MVTVAIVAVMAAIAYPSYSEFIQRWRKDSATKALVADLQLARTVAIKTSRAVKVCTTTDSTSCGTATDWKGGWIVIDGKNKVIAARSAPQGIASMSSGAAEFKFLPNGLMGSAADAVTITPSGAKTGDKVNKVDISKVGRATITSATK